MPESLENVPLQLVIQEGASPGIAEADPNDRSHKIATLTLRIADLERQLIEVTRQESGADRELETIRTRHGDLEQQRRDADEAAHESALAATEHEVAKVRDQASAQADDIVEGGRQQLKSLEEEQRALAMKLDVTRALYDELQSTLRNVAESAISELVEARSSLAEIEAAQSPRTPKPQRRSDDERPPPRPAPRNH